MMGIASALAVSLSACSDSGDAGSTPDVPTVAPATAVEAPPTATAPPAGIVVPTAAHSRALALDGDVVAVLDPAGTTVTRYRTGDLNRSPEPVTTPPLTRLIASGDGFLGAGPSVLVRIGRDGTLTKAQTTADEPTALAHTAAGEVLVGTRDGRILVFGKDLQKIREIRGFVRVDDITVSPPGADLDKEQVVVLDRAQSSVTPVTIADGEFGAALRAGDGSTNAVVDRYGRVITANTRDGEILGFFGSPLVMRFRYPVPGGPYAVDYDDARNLAWVSTTGSNEVVAYDLSGGEPAEKHRYPTVAQPNHITVDQRDGTVYVLSDRTGLQAINVR